MSIAGTFSSTGGPGYAHVPSPLGAGPVQVLGLGVFTNWPRGTAPGGGYAHARLVNSEPNSLGSFSPDVQRLPVWNKAHSTLWDIGILVHKSHQVSWPIRVTGDASGQIRNHHQRVVELAGFGFIEESRWTRKRPHSCRQ